MEKQKKFVVVGIWYGLFNEGHREWYSGVLHESRSEARCELINAKLDHNFDAYVIEEVSDETDNV